MTVLTLELHPAGPEGGTLRERLRTATAEAAGDATIEYVAVVVRLVPVADGRPDAVKLRRALKSIGRRAKLRVAWYAPARRHKPVPPKPRKRKVPRAEVPEHRPDAAR